MHLISRLRDVADLRYLYSGERTGKKGRPQMYAGKVDNKNIDITHFTLVFKDDKEEVHSAIVNSKSLKRTINLVHVLYNNAKGRQGHKLYFSTDTKMDAADILRYYQSRFQIEFLYRDGKQHTGLNDCQARSKNKLDFQFNVSLTAINIAKISHWLNLPADKRKSFSMADIKIINHNALQMNLFFDKFGINPHLPKNRLKIKELLYHGTIAA